MTSTITLREENIDTLKDAIDIFYKMTDVSVHQKDFIGLVLDTDPREIANMAIKNMRRRMEKIGR